MATGSAAHHPKQVLYAYSLLFEAVIISDSSHAPEQFLPIKKFIGFFPILVTCEAICVKWIQLETSASFTGNSSLECASGSLIHLEDYLLFDTSNPLTAHDLYDASPLMILILRDVCSPETPFLFNSFSVINVDWLKLASRSGTGARGTWQPMIFTCFGSSSPSKFSSHYSFNLARSTCFFFLVLHFFFLIIFSM